MTSGMGENICDNGQAKDIIISSSSSSSSGHQPQQCLLRQKARAASVRSRRVSLCSANNHNGRSDDSSAYTKP